MTRVFIYVVAVLIYDPHEHRLTRSATQNNLPARATSTAVSFWWLSFAHGLGRGSGRGSSRGDYTLCTHGGIAKKVVAHFMQCIMQPSSSLPQTEHDRGDHKILALCCFVSYCYLLAGPRAPGIEIIYGILIENRFPIRNEPSGTTVPHTTFIYRPLSAPADWY